MRAARRPWLALLLLACGFLSTATVRAEACRIAYDMGSSGIRAGASSGQRAPAAEIDFLAPLTAGRNLDETLDQTIAALNGLPEKGAFPAECRRVAGGFSAWRLALQRDANELIPALRRIHAGSAVSLLVIPQKQEGAYGYVGAQQLLGERLSTSHVLDIGGGSLQIAGAQSSYGETLGQKVWHRHLCQLFKKVEAPCSLQPMTPEQLLAARMLLQDKLSGVRAALPVPVALTAISRPVTRGILPALRRLTATGVDQSGFSLSVLSEAIERLALLNQAETTELTGIGPRFVSYLLSDMLLVEGILRASGGDFLAVAEIDLTNLPGLLLDERAFAWGQHYECYLQRLQAVGVDAYHSDPATCH